MSTTNPATHHFGQTSTGNYEADLARMKEDLADMFKDKLGFVTGKSRLINLVLLRVRVGYIVGRMLILSI